MKTDQEEIDAIEEYLSGGGKVTVCPAGERTDPELIGNSWTKKKGGRPPAAARKSGEE